MGQQIRKATKRRRRAEYIKRKKEQAKMSSGPSIRLAVSVARKAPVKKPAAKQEEPAAE